FFSSVRKHQRPSRSSGSDQPVRLSTPHESGARSRFIRRNRQPYPPLHGRQIPPRFSRQSEDASNFGGNGKILSENSEYRPVQRSHPQRQLFARLVSHPPVLAQRRRTLHHSAMRCHARSQDRQAQRGLLQNASFR